MELEIEILWHTDETIKKDRMDIDADVEEYDRRTHTFYHIDAICPFYVNKEPILCQIFASGNKFLSAYDYETTRSFINAAKQKDIKVSEPKSAKENEELRQRNVIHRQLVRHAVIEWMKRQPKARENIGDSYHLFYKGIPCFCQFAYNGLEDGVEIRPCLISDTIVGKPDESLWVSSMQIIKGEI